MTCVSWHNEVYDIYILSFKDSIFLLSIDSPIQVDTNWQQLFSQEKLWWSPLHSWELNFFFSSLNIFLGGYSACKAMGDLFIFMHFKVLNISWVISFPQRNLAHSGEKLYIIKRDEMNCQKFCPNCLNIRQVVTGKIYFSFSSVVCGHICLFLTIYEHIFSDPIASIYKLCEFIHLVVNSSLPRRGEIRTGEISKCCKS